MADDSIVAAGDPDNEARALLQRALDRFEVQKNSALAWSATAVGTFNAAALATSINLSDKLYHSGPVISVFGSALAFTFITAAVYAYAMSEMWDKIDGALDFMKLDPVDRTLENAKSLPDNSEAISEPLQIPILTGIITAVLTIAGIVLFAFNAKLDDVANTRRCIAIQRDMLSAKPRRDDGPDLFQALGCRPQGEGSVYAPPQNKSSRLQSKNSHE